VDIGRSFTFFLDDPEWVKKLLLGALISLIPFVGGFIIFGWALAVTRSVYNGVDNVIPDWSDLGGYLVRGLLAWVGALIWAAPILLVFICLGVGIVATSGSDAAVAVLVLSGFGLAMIAVVYMAIFLPIPIARYAVKGEFGAMFEFSSILAEVRRGLRPLLIAMIIWLVASMIVAPIGILACFVGVYVTSALSYLMIGHAMGQAYREIDRPDPLRATPAF
jgi:hypothetical protein